MRLRLAGRTLVTNSLNVAVAIVFAIMGSFVLYLASSAQMTSGPGIQVAIGRGLSQAFAEIQSWVAPIPEPVLGLGLLLLAAGFVFATLTDHRGHRTGRAAQVTRWSPSTPRHPERTAAMSRPSHKTGPSGRQARLAVMRAREARRRRLRLSGWTAGLVAVISVITVMLVTSRPVESGRQRVAPAFALTDTAGAVHQLADHKGENVLLYFNEGAGCDACFYQMVEIEKRSPEFAKLGVTVLPIAANPVEAVRRDIVRFGLNTPWLLDPDVRVSTAYGTVGRGMHAGLPGHGFVLVDTQGRQRWYGEYPTMFVPADELLAEVRTRLT